MRFGGPGGGLSIFGISLATAPKKFWHHPQDQQNHRREENQQNVSARNTCITGIVACVNPFSPVRCGGMIRKFQVWPRIWICLKIVREADEKQGKTRQHLRNPETFLLAVATALHDILPRRSSFCFCSSCVVHVLAPGRCVRQSLTTSNLDDNRYIT